MSFLQLCFTHHIVPGTPPLPGIPETQNRCLWKNKWSFGVGGPIQTGLNLWSGGIVSLPLWSFPFAFIVCVDRDVLVLSRLLYPVDKWLFSTQNKVIARATLEAIENKVLLPSQLCGFRLFLILWRIGQCVARTQPRSNTLDGLISSLGLFHSILPMSFLANPI